MYKRQLHTMKPTAIMKDVIYIKTNRIGFIPQIHMQGPIVTPIPVTREVAKQMVVAGIEVFEIYKDRKGNKKVRLLTLQNVYPGEGDCPPVDENTDKDGGKKKPSVPTSGVAQQEPVQPVKLKGVSIQQPDKNEKDLEEEKNAEMTEEEEDSSTETSEQKPQNVKRKNKKNR